MMLAALAALSLSGCTQATLNTGDNRRAVALAPFNRPAGLGQIRVVEGMAFYPAQVNGAAAWCSNTPGFFTGVSAEPLCLTAPDAPDATEGWFKTAIVIAPAVVYRFDADVPYRILAGPALPPRR